MLEGADASEASAEVLRFLLGMKDATEEEPAAAIDVDEDDSDDEPLYEINGVAYYQ